MSQKKKSKSRKTSYMKNFKKLDLNNLKIPNIISIEGTKKKIGNFYSNYKKQKNLEKKKSREK